MDHSGIDCHVVPVGCSDGMLRYGHGGRTVCLRAAASSLFAAGSRSHEPVPESSERLFVQYVLMSRSRWMCGSDPAAIDHEAMINNESPRSILVLVSLSRTV